MDFCIRKQHMFSRNIFSKQGLDKSKNLKNLKKYYDVLNAFFKKIVVQLENSINKYSTFDEIIDSNLIDFC